jgi:ribosomal-protein-alanine N-acetyltransferase
LREITLPAEQPELSTARLKLRRFVADDAAQVHRLAGDAAVADTTLLIPHPYPDGAAQDWIASHADEWTAARAATWAIVWLSDGTLLGALALHLRLAHRLAVAGYWVGQPYWRQGIAAEALQAAVAWGFDGVGLHRIEATHMKRNPASGRVMEKAGMALEGVMRQAACKNGRMEDLVLRAVLATDARHAPVTANR